jgi:Tol biopolymer transport system component
MPAWSPGGQRLAFVSDRDSGNWEIYVMAPNGTGQRRLTNSSEDEASLAWSPDGEKIAFATDATGDPTIWVMSADGSDRKRLTDGLFPTWSPDGERIAYTDYFGDRPYLAVMNADGSGQRGIGASLVQKVFGIGVAEEPDWSPDGERIAFASFVGSDNEEIFVTNVDGSQRTRLTDIPGNDHWPPTWSADGKRIAFTSDGRAGKGEIFVMNSDGSGLTKLTDNPADDMYPDWRT